MPKNYLDYWLSFERSKSLFNFFDHYQLFSVSSYIALELCAATLADFIEGRYEPGPNITEDTILSQATSGLNHLHSLNIGISYIH